VATFHPDTQKPLEEERKANAARVAAAASVGFTIFAVLAVAGWLGLEHYLEAVHWDVPADRYQVSEQADAVTFKTGELSPVVFAPQPAVNVTRVLVVGGSTAAGSPERPAGDIALPQSYGVVGALQMALEASGAPIELVNLGVADGTSADALRMLRRAEGWGAEGVIVYTGHREFIGLPEVFNSDIWFSVLYRKLKSGTPRSAPRSERWVDDPWYGNERNYGAVVNEFRSNLRAIGRVAEQQGMAVLAVQPAANLGGMDPSWSTSGRDFDMRALWTYNTQSLEGIYQNRTDVAEANWALGKRREEEQHDPHRPLLDAVDADGLPLRATSHIRDVIDEVAREKSWAVVDAQAAVRPSAGAAGDREFYDDVRPRPPASAAIAQAIGAAMADAGLLSAPPTVDAPMLSSGEAADAALVAAERWLELTAMRAYDPGFRLTQAQLWTDRALESRPDDATALAFAAVIARMRSDERPPQLTRDPAIRARLDAIHPTIRHLIDGE